MVTIARVGAVAVAAVPTDIVTVTTGRQLWRRARKSSGAPKAASRARHKTSAQPHDMQPDTLGRYVSDTHGTFVPASLSPSYRGVGWEQSPNPAEQMMSCVRCSMEVLSVRLFCPWSVSGTG